MSIIQKIFNKIKHELRFSNPHYYTRVSEKILKGHYRAVLKKRIELLPAVSIQKEDAKLTLAILANKRNFYESVAALYSFCYWYNNLLIHYHEDGTLTDKEIAFLKKIFPGITVFKRAEQDLKADTHLQLKGLNNCAKLRWHFIFSLRLFDMLIEKQTPYLLQIDSDVLFFSKPQEILDIVETGNKNGCFNIDIESAAYTFTNETIAQYVSKPMIPRFNAGVFMHNFGEDLFDFAEMILEREPQSVNSWHLEQTLFAMFASIKGNFSALPKQYDLGRKERNLGHKITSEHYVHSTGYDFHKDFIYKLYPVYKA